MRTTAYLKAIMEVYGKTITGLGPAMGQMVNGQFTVYTFIHVYVKSVVKYRGEL